jgi:hypothetical protein
MTMGDNGLVSGHRNGFHRYVWTLMGIVWKRGVTIEADIRCLPYK